MLDSQLANFLTPLGFMDCGLISCEKPQIQSRLSDILERETGGNLSKYYLSETAKAGILRRAEKRGKRLPEMLETALRGVGFTPSSFGQYSQEVGTQRANGGDVGPGSEVLVMTHGQHSPVTQYGAYAGTLTARHDSSPCADRGANVLAIRTDQQGVNGSNISVGVSPTLDRAQPPAVAFAQNQEGELRVGDVANTLGTTCNASARATGKVCIGIDEECNARIDGFGTLLKGGQGGTRQSVMHSAIVRRITPGEAEKLQGFHSDHTKIPYRGKSADLCPDGPRYKALGNSWAVPVAQWVFERIDKVDKL